MCITRLLPLSLLISICAVSAVAQSPSESVPGSFYSEPVGALPQPALAHLRLDQIQQPVDIDRLYLPYATPEADRAGERDWNIKVPPPSYRRALDQNDATCYSIRSYRVTRDDPESDSTRLVAYSTCQPAARYQVKEAGARQAIVPR
ncbi:MAG: hypothetical protein WAN60_01320 [Candidatus Sulfotelmatobacter sp.]